ncbi:MAG: hypothetical protein JW757_09510 [Anaerolineales bacterium]|nr:hypothetical protein [Anaerolineales bacterium]
MANPNIVSETALLAEMVALRRSEGLSHNAACKQIAHELDRSRWTGSYVKSLLSTNPPVPGKEVRAAIRRLYRTFKPHQFPKRYWLKVQADSAEELREWIERIPMSRRKEILREEINRIRNQDLGQGEAPPPKQKSG